MRKLYLLLDEWKNDKNFVGSELEEIKKHFDVTVICNDFEDKDSVQFPNGIRFFFYNRRNTSGKIKAIFHAIIDKSTWNEIRRTKSESNRISKISEIVRFYINAELFYCYLKKNGLFEDNSDAVYYSYWYFWKCFAITKHKKDNQNIKIITRTHEYDLYTVSIPSGYQPFKCEMDKNLDKIIFIAEHGRQYYLNKYGYNLDDKYQLYHLGTKDYQTLNPYDRQEKFVLVSCSSVIPRKRVGLIVDALEEIDDINIEWIHFGSGELLVELNEQANKKLGSKSNISYKLMGYTNHEDIMDFYAANSVDAFIMVAVSEGNPVSVMEAMSFGIPIISANICNMSNVIKDNGALVSENPDGLEIRKAIHTLSSLDIKNINAMRSASYEIWSNSYREDVNNKKFVNEVLLEL